MFTSSMRDCAFANIGLSRLSDEEIANMMIDERASNFIGYNEKDILSGRGGLANKHNGNILFRRLVEIRKPLYKQLPEKYKKAALVRSIVRTMKSNGSRFLKMDHKSQLWVELSDKEARLKTSQALREPDRKAESRMFSDSESCSSQEYCYSEKKAFDPLPIRNAPTRCCSYSLRCLSKPPVADHSSPPLPITCFSMSPGSEHIANLPVSTSTSHNCEPPVVNLPEDGIDDDPEMGTCLYTIHSTNDPTTPQIPLLAQSSVALPKDLDDFFINSESLGSSFW